MIPAFRMLHGVARVTRRLSAFLVLLALACPGAALSQTITTVAGRNVGDGGAATSAVLHNPNGIAVDSAGNLYIADYNNYRIRKVAAGVVTTIAGNGLYTHSGDGGAATSAGVAYPRGIAVDSAGNVYFATQSRIRKIAAATGTITTIAGGSSSGYSGDGAAATSAKLNGPRGILLDAAGNLYIADYSNHRIRKVSASTGIITTVAGNGTAALAGDGGAATSASISYPTDVAADASANLYIADSNNLRVRKVTASTGIITTVAGGGASVPGDNGTATSAALSYPQSVAVDSAGILYIGDGGYRIRKVTSGIITTVAGTGTSGFSGDGAAATSARITYLVPAIAVDSALNLYFTDTYAHRIRKVTKTTGFISTVAGSGVVDGTATNSALYLPRGMALDTTGNIYFADSNSNRVRKVTASTGNVATIAGTDAYSVPTDGGLATAAYLSYPTGVAVDASGNVYIADNGTSRIRKIAAGTGLISTYAGSVSGFSGDSGPATNARLADPQGIAIDSSGNLYIADYSNHRIRKVTAAGVISTVAGNGTAAYSGDGGAATSASLYFPIGVAVDAAGNLYIADYYNNVIRKVSAGIISTVAGSGSCCYGGDFGPAIEASIDPRGVAVDAAGNVFIADGDSRVRRVAAATGIVTTAAGSGTQGYSGDGGVATSAMLQFPTEVAVDTSGNLYIADNYNGRIRKVTADTAAPGTTITSYPTTTYASGYATFTFTSSDGAAAGFQCSVDGAAYSACSATATFAGLAPGSHTLSVRAVDGWGNVDATPATVSWTVTPATLSSGMNYQCTINVSGNVVCWGDNESGKLGTGEPIFSTSPVSVGGLATSLSAIQASQNHSCALTSGGDVLCWGGNYFGELGNGTETSSSTPTKVNGLPGSAVAVTAGVSHTCALTTAGAVHCWGINLDGQLGSSTVSHHSVTPVAVQGLSSGVVAIAAGSYHTCAVTNTGAARCWGNNFNGQLGNGTTTDTAVPSLVLGLSSVQSISAGAKHTCAVTTSGAVYCWGGNLDGQLGNGSTTDSSLPVPASLTPAARSISVSDFISCAVTTAGALYCWGTNFWGILGTGVAINTRVTTPTVVGAFSTGASTVSASRTHVCAVKSPGIAYCWGYNAYGGVGDGTTIDRSTPVAVSGLATDITTIAAGNFHSCALNSSRRAVCWGYNGEGQLGGGSSIGRVTPTPVAGLGSGVLAVETGWSHTCAVNSAKGVVCWGSNASGKLGNDSFVTTSSPVAVQGLASGVNTVALGGSHTCAATTTGAVLCWGDNSRGQLGSFSGRYSRVPVPISGMPSSVVALAAGWSHTCALTAQGSVYCWGTDLEGALGSGSTTTTYVPLQVFGLPSDIRGISGSLYHQCAVSAAGSVWCWGNNLDGQLGDGTFTSSTYPVEVLGLSDPVARISTGHYHSCALSTAGSVLCWGYNGEGQLGDGIAGDSAYPVKPKGLATGAAGVSAGSNSCGVTSVGAVLCWGANDFGQVGDGTYVPRSVPATVLGRDGGGSLDGNDWYLDLDPSKAKAIATELTPKVLTVSQQVLAGEGVKFDTTVKYKASEYGKPVANFVFALVPPQFFSMVKRAPGASTESQLRAKSGSALVFAQLTPAGWTNQMGQLIALSQGVANAAGGANNILNGTRTDLIPGARFCVGYGTSATDMLTSDSFREVLALEGAASTVDNRACVLSGIYLDGPATSNLGTAVTFTATVIGVAPTGSVQMQDGSANLGSAVTLTARNEAASSASFVATALAAGSHSIGANYGGDGLNPAASTGIPLLHTVAQAATGSSVAITGVASSTQGETVTFTATITGNNPSGTVQFKDGAANLGSPSTLLNGKAMMSVSTLALGNHSISAAYSGDGANTASISSALAHTVYAAVTTSVALASSGTLAPAGTAVTFTATVTGSNPAGSVMFRDGSTMLGTVALVNGTASLTLATLAAGTHVITAEYSGDGTNQAVTSDAVFQQVSVTATFALAVTKSGTGAGTVSSSPSGIDCDPACSANFGSGTTVTLTAAPASGSAFAGWSGACSGTGACQVTMDVVRSVNAAFNATGTAGNLTPSPSALAFGGQSMSTTSPALSVTLTNPASSSMTVSSVTASTYFAVSHDCATVAGRGTCTANLTFTPAVQGSLNGTLTVVTSVGTMTVPLSGTGEKSLVTHYYRSILRRAPDSGGKTYWDSEAARVQALGVNVNEVWFAMAGSFYFSTEYVAFSRDDAGFVTDLYSTFFNRPPDAGGFADWTAQLAAGMPREVVGTSFMFSTEFAAFTQGIFGTANTRKEVDTVVDFFRGLLARLPDDGGFNFWVQQFRTAQCQGGAAVNAQVESISSQFALSGEYAARNRSNSQYVGDLYNAFLRRGGDLAGVQFWISQITTGARSRENVRQAFVASPEFQARVAAIIAQGCLQ